MNRVPYIILLISSFALYPIINGNPNNAVNSNIIKFWIDDYIPLIPVFSVPYIAYIPFLLITSIYFIFFTQKFRSMSLSLAFCQIVASLFFVFYQTTVSRPDIFSTDIFSRLVLFIYSKDQPYNCFPSLHVALSTISGLFWIQRFPRISWFIGFFVFLISLSTIFVKQHYTPDILGGFILAILSYYAGTYIEKHRMRTSR
jgi:membrane-associated phospholipid phosphatase